MSKRIYGILNDEEFIKKMALEITDEFVKKGNKDNVDYSFDIAKGTGKLKTRQPNTTFSFDTTPGSALDDFKKTLFSKELADITDTEEGQLKNTIDDFMKKVGASMISNYQDSIRDTLRRVVLPASNTGDIPLSTVEVSQITIVDYSSMPEPSKYLCKIAKTPETNINTGEVVQYIHEKQEETGKSVEEIFEEEREENPIFSNIEAVESGRKYIYDVEVVFFVDYSLAKMPPKPPHIK